MKTEEKALIVRTKGSISTFNRDYRHSLNRFAIAEKEGVRGYASGKGTTCTREEVKERDRRTRQLRVQRMLQTR